MKLLFDQGTPAPLRHVLVGHEITTAREMGWDELKNGELLLAAESQFDAFVTTDQSLKYQQNMQGRRLSILVLPTTSWPRIQRHVALITAALLALQPADVVELQFPEV